MKNVILLYFCLWSTGWATDIESSFLDPEKAFQLTVTKEDSTLVLHWSIAEGYVLYRDKFNFFAQDDHKKLKLVVDMPLPTCNPSIVEKENAECYQDQLEIKFNLVDLPKSRLTVIYQGCFPSGICYHPITKVISF